MIEISNEELAKVLNLWTGTEEWKVIESEKKLWCGDWVQRDSDGNVYDPEDYAEDKAAHDLVNFMLKERKYPAGARVFFMVRADGAAEQYIEWVKDWEVRFGGGRLEPEVKAKDIDHSIPVRYDHLISTEELVKRAKERWPNENWNLNDTFVYSDNGRPAYFRHVEKQIQGGTTSCLHQTWIKRRAHLLTLIDEARSEGTTPEVEDMAQQLEECRRVMPVTKAERFYAFLATPQLDISPGLWGLERELQAPVRGGDGEWPRENTVGFSYASRDACEQCLGGGWYMAQPCCDLRCKASS